MRAILKANLLFCSQILDLKKPVVVALTMADLAKRKGIQIDLTELERELGVPVVSVNPRKQRGIQHLKKVIEQTASRLYKVPARDFIENESLATTSIENIQQIFPQISDYKAIHYLINHEQFALNNGLQDKIESIEQTNAFNPTKTQATEILQRYSRIKHIMQVAVTEPDPLEQTILLINWTTYCFIKDGLPDPFGRFVYIISKCFLAGPISNDLDRMAIFFSKRLVGYRFTYRLV